MIKPTEVPANATPETGETPDPIISPTEAVQITVSEPVMSENASPPPGIEASMPDLGGSAAPLSLTSETTESRSDASVPLPDDDFEMEETESSPMIPAGQRPTDSETTHLSETQVSMEVEDLPGLTPIVKESEENAPASKFLKGAEGSKKDASTNQGAKASNSETGSKFLTGAHHRMTAAELSTARFKFDVHNKRK